MFDFIEPTSQTDAKLSVEYRLVDDLKLDANNPRHHSPSQVQKLAKSIESFGFNVPVLIDRDHKVIAGHARVLAARKLGLKEIPAIRIEHLTEAQARAFRIADNRLTELATWDHETLARELKDLTSVKLDFGIEATAFKLPDIKWRTEGLERSGSRKDPADRLPPGGPPVSRPGDLWLLGRHRLLCGNAVQAADYASLMGDERAAMVFTEPPHQFVLPKDHPADILTYEEHFKMSLTEAARLMATNSADGAIYYLCADWRLMGAVVDVGKAANSHLLDLCVWAKEAEAAHMGTFYQSQHQFIFVFRRSRALGRSNPRRTRRRSGRSNLWHYRSGIAKPVVVQPVAMVADAIRDSSAHNDVVLDAFLGFGTTIMASERTGRRGFGLEVEPMLVDAAVRRWQVFAGQKAVHAGTGKAFADMEAEARARHAV